MTVDEKKLRSTTDAKVWAEEFAKVCPEVDQGLMIGWFANAIEQGRRVSAVDVTARFTDRAKKAVELSFRDALRRGHNHIDTEHLLLGLIGAGVGPGAPTVAGEEGVRSDGDA